MNNNDITVQLKQFLNYFHTHLQNMTNEHKVPYDILSDDINIHPKVIIDEIKNTFNSILTIHNKEYSKLEEILQLTEESFRKLIKLKNQYKLHSYDLTTDFKLLFSSNR